MGKDTNEDKKSSLTASQVLEVTEGIVGKLHERVDYFQEALHEFNNKIDKIEKEKGNYGSNYDIHLDNTIVYENDVKPDEIHKQVNREIGEFVKWIMRRYPIKGLEIRGKGK